jgi:hypothetical protein
MPLWLAVTLIVVGLELGFVAGAYWKRWCDVQQAEEKRIRIIWLGVKTSIQTGHYIQTTKAPRDFIRVTDLPGNPMRVN